MGLAEIGIGYMLWAARALTVVELAALVAGSDVPRPLRVGVAMSLALACAPLLGPTAAPAGWVPALAVEVAVGAAFGLSSGLIVAAAQMAGLAATDGSDTLTETLSPALVMCGAGALLFGTGAHHAWLEALALSYAVAPWWDTAPTSAADALGAALQAAVLFALPVLLVRAFAEVVASLVADGSPAGAWRPAVVITTLVVLGSGLTDGFLRFAAQMLRQLAGGHG